MLVPMLLVSCGGGEGSGTQHGERDGAVPDASSPTPPEAGDGGGSPQADAAIDAPPSGSQDAAKDATPPPADAPAGCATAGCPAIETFPDDCWEATCDPTGSCVYQARDADGDGFRAKRCLTQTVGVVVSVGEDCNDADPGVNPAAWDGPAFEDFAEGCNDGIDQDCNGLIDDATTLENASCVCSPGETTACSETASGLPVGYPFLGDDGKPVGTCVLGSKECLPNGTWGPCVGAVGPGPEACGGNDEDCDGVPSDEDDSTPKHEWVCDVDGDTRLSPDAPLNVACNEPASECNGAWVRNPDAVVFDDCDDGDGDIFLGNDEVCDGKDNNCNTYVDDNALDAPYWSYDGDEDNFRSPAYAVLRQCDAPTEAPPECTGACPGDTWREGGTPLSSGDCDDANPLKNPSAHDPCNGVDFNCDGSAVTGCACTTAQTRPCGLHPGFDGKGICSAGTETCAAGSWGGCVGSVGPETEVCGVSDRDCDGTPGNQDADSIDRKTWVCDADNDGHALADAEAVLGCLAPTAPCAGTWRDRNVTPVDDCDDGNAATYPGAVERCDRRDNDCSSGGGEVTAEDYDNDGYATSTAGCVYSGVGTFPKTDCNDGSSDYRPGAPAQTRPTCLSPIGLDLVACKTTAGVWGCKLNGPLATCNPASWDYDCDGTVEKKKYSSTCVNTSQSQCHESWAPGVEYSASCGDTVPKKICTGYPLCAVADSSTETVIVSCQ